jgi:hypothetical protein
MSWDILLNVNEASWGPVRGSNEVPPEHKSEALRSLCQLACSVKGYGDTNMVRWLFNYDISTVMIIGRRMRRNDDHVWYIGKDWEESSYGSFLENIRGSSGGTED